MPDILFLADADVALDSNGDVATSRVQVAKQGSFKDPRYGKFTITQKNFDDWIANFDALFSPQAGRAGVPLDVDHSPEKQGTTDAAGWIVGLDQMGKDGATATPTELWATVQWTVLGKELVDEGRYRYISPSYQHNYTDESGKQHGTALVGAALTNRPFLQMATVSLSRDALLATVDDEAVELATLSPKDRIQLPKADFVFPDKAPGSGSYPIPDIAHGRDALARSVGKPEEADVRKAVLARYPELKGAQHSTYSPPVMPELTNIAQALNLSEDADEATILATLSERMPGEGAVIVEKVTLAQLTADATAGREARDELRQTKFDTAFTLAVDEGRVTPAQREKFEALYAKDAGVTLDVLKELPPKVNTSAPRGHGDGGPETAGIEGQTLDLGDGAEYPIDADGLVLHAKIEALCAEKNIDYATAANIVLSQGSVI